MAANEDGADTDEDIQRLRNARRVQELFHGRFTQHDSILILRHCDWEVNAAVAFIFESTEQELRNVTGENEWQVVVRARRDQNLQANARNNRVDAEIRQFGCGEDDNMWWRKVPVRKRVSKCRLCLRKFDAIPRENEWGWSEFNCPCGNVFFAFGAMGIRNSPCYACGLVCEPIRVLPPLKTNRRRSRNRHSCTAQNCYNRTPPGPGEPFINICVHPRSLMASGRTVLVPSHPHNSTGSTVKTFLTQTELIDPHDEYEPSLADIDEVRSDDGNSGDN